jgi:hypothetical protein
LGLSALISRNAAASFSALPPSPSFPETWESVMCTKEKSARDGDADAIAMAHSNPISFINRIGEV